jgi:hypothetical protein
MENGNVPIAMKLNHHQLFIVERKERIAGVKSVSVPGKGNIAKKGVKKQETYNN